MRGTAARRVRARAVTVLVATSVLAACTDPTAAGGPPTFVLLGDASSVVTSTLIRELPADSCPSIEALPADWPRRPVATTAATITLPPVLDWREAGFGSRPGRVFLEPFTGLVAVSRDMELAELRSSPTGVLTRTGARDDRANWFFSARCRISLDGRPATLVLTRVGVPVRGPGFEVSVREEPGLPAAIFGTAPDGRRVNVYVSPANGFQRSFREDPLARTLLAVAASLRW